MQRTYHHGKLKVAVIAAARDRLRTSADGEISLREVARGIGVSANAPYRHFPGKDGLTVALAAEGYRELTAIAERALLQRGSAVAALAAEYSRFWQEEPRLLGLVGSENFAGRDPESEVVLARDEWFAALVAIVEEEAGRLPAAEAYRRAAAIWALLQGVAQLRGFGGRGLLSESLLPDAAELARKAARGR
ncbi:MAG: TetR/AcrR family transcriptional regulator [Gemmatimonadales bacterium]